MELGSTVTEIMDDLRRAGAIGGEETTRIVDLLLASVESSVRLHLLEALYAAARELEASTAGVGVEIRLEGRDPVLSLVQSHPDGGTGGTRGPERRRLSPMTSCSGSRFGCPRA